MNTLENKAKFFAQYYDQEVLFPNIENNPRFRCLTEWETITDISYLELKPLSSITDEDAIEVLNILMGYDGFMFKDWHKSYQEKWLKTIKIDLLDGFGSRQTGLLPYFKVTWQTADYLRSSGYALPWNGISVKQQIEYGWIKLQNRRHPL